MPCTTNSSFVFKLCRLTHIKMNLKQCENNVITENKASSSKYKWNIVWTNAILLAVIHIFGLYGFFQWILRSRWLTFVFSHLYATVAALGVTAGTHRLWSHRSYKAKLPLRIFLAASHSAAFQSSVYEWVRDHRVHHKYVDTDADPHNAKRGLFYSHVGWLMLKKSKEVLEKGRTIDLSDVIGDPVVKFQHKYRLWIFLVMGILIPTFIPWYFFKENLWTSFSVCGFRYMLVINLIMTINSFAHKYGTRPYEKDILATDGQPCSDLVLGEGWHNYHHVFPWDYRAAEFGSNGMSTRFIKWMENLGFATELKIASEELIRKRMMRTGDGTITEVLSKSSENQCNVDEYDQHLEENLWGWGDIDMNNTEKEEITKYNRLK